MAISITDIKGFDTVAGSRIIINQNFSVLSDAINNLSTYVNISDKTISNIEKLTVKRGTSNITETLFDTNGSISVGGNIVASGAISATSITLTNGQTISNGDITISSSSSNLINNGNLLLDGEFVQTDATSASVDASNELYFSNTNTTNLIYNGNTAIAGKVDLTGRSVITLSWSNFVATNDSQYYLHRILLKTLPTTRVGQRILIIAKINEDLTLPHYSSEQSGYWVLRDTLAYSDGNPISTGIKFTKSYQTAELIFDGLNWLILNVNGATIS